MAIEANEEQNESVAETNTETEANAQDNHLEKLVNLRNLLNEDLTGCDAKWTIFVSAAQSYRFLNQLKPVPPQYVTDVSISNGLDILSLLKTIDDTPRLHTLLVLLNTADSKDLNPKVIDLVYWVLVSQRTPILRSINAEELSINLMDYLENSSIEKPTQVFTVIPVPDSPTELEFNNNKENYTTSFGFFGSQLDTFYSLLCNGFKDFKNPNNCDGKILELYAKLEDSVHRSPASAGWGFSSCGSILSCIAICEFIENPELVKYQYRIEKCKKIHFTNSNLVRISSILMYGNRTTDDSVDMPKIEEKSWMARNKNLLSVTLSLVVVVTALSSTKGGGYIKNFCAKSLGQAIALCSGYSKLDLLNKLK